MVNAQASHLFHVFIQDIKEKGLDAIIPELQSYLKKNQDEWWIIVFIRQFEERNNTSFTQNN